MSQHLIALWLAALLSTQALAEDVPPSAEIENDYPASILHRPLVLPRGLGQAWFGFELDNNPNPSPSTLITPTSSTRLGLGYDHGLGGGFQLGLNAELQVNPDSFLRSWFLSAQYRLSREVSTRLDIGQRQIIDCTNEPWGTMAIGLGFPFKHQLNEKVALVGGSTLGADVFDDVIFVENRDCQKPRTYLHLPVGFLFQSDEVVAFRVGAGYRTLFGEGVTGTHFIPVRLEGIMTFEQNFDVGFGIHFAGKLGASSDVDKLEFELFENRLFITGAYRF